MVWSAIIGGVTSLASGLLRNKAEKDARDEARAYAEENPNRIDYEALVKDAEKAGINPLTALRSGGSAGYTQTHAPIFAPSGSSAIADGVDAFGRGIQSAFDYDPLAEEKSQLELQIMEAQLRRINEGAGIDTRLGGAPVASGSQYEHVRGEAYPELWERGRVTVTNPHLFRSVDPRYSDAEVVAMRYGEIVGEAYGIGNLARDYYYDEFSSRNPSNGGRSRADRELAYHNNSADRSTVLVGPKRGLSRGRPNYTKAREPEIRPKRRPVIRRKRGDWRKNRGW